MSRSGGMKLTLTGKLCGNKGKDGSYRSFGLSVRKADRKQLCCRWKDRLQREGLDIVLPGEAEDVHVSPNVFREKPFWTTCPEFRSPLIGDWMERREDRAEHGRPWPKGKPPKYDGCKLTTDGERVTLRVNAPGLA